MQHFSPDEAETLGADLRAIRKARCLTLSELADKLGRSVGWLSQVERDLSEPSITDLRQIAQVLGVPISAFFGQSATPATEQGYVVRSGARRSIGSDSGGLIEELLSPDLTDDFEMVHCTFEPQSTSGEVIQRATQEVGYVVSGQLEIEIAERRFTVGPGDSFRIRGESHRWLNPFDKPAEVIWVIAPPIY